MKIRTRIQVSLDVIVDVEAADLEDQIEEAKILIRADHDFEHLFTEGAEYRNPRIKYGKWTQERRPRDMPAYSDKA